jgi:hypothetical protein
MTDAVSHQQEDLRRSMGLPKEGDTYRWLHKRRRTPREWIEVIPTYEPLERSGDLDGAIAYYRGFGMNLAEQSFSYVRLASPRRFKRFWWTVGLVLALPTFGGSLVFCAIMVWMDRAGEERAVIEMSALGDGRWIENRHVGVEPLGLF